MEFGVKDEKERLRYYRGFVYEKGSLRAVKKERQKGFELSSVDRFKYRTQRKSDLYFYYSERINIKENNSPGSFQFEFSG